MIPSDREIRVALRRDFIRITPPSPERAFSSMAVDLTHHEAISIWLAQLQTLARLGVGVHVTAPTIHAGFGTTEDPKYPGTRIRLEIWNCGPLHVCLERGMKICQLILEEVHGTPEKGYEGAFATQAPDVVPTVPTTAEAKPRKRRRQ